MALTTPNQILHYTASAANYPSWAIRVGNFAVSDVGNNVQGSWGTFRLGLNPKSFTFTASVGQYGINGFAKQTYAVYIYKPDLLGTDCKGPSCFLLDDVKIIPNTNEDYPGGVSTTNPWYHLVKFTQWIGASSSLVSNYNENMEDDISTYVGRVNNTLRWYRDQLSLGDARTYEGGTAGNRVVVNKFYPPIIANTASRIFDSSYVASLPWAPGSVNSGSKIYNLSGLTHGVIASNETLQYWDYEGGYTKPNGGLTLFDIPQDTGFALSGNAQEPSFWTLNMYVMMTNADTNYDQFLIKGGDDVSDVNGMFAGIGFRNDSGIYRLTLGVRLSSGSARQDYTINGASFSLNQWYYISVVREELEDYKFYLNGKYVGTSGNIGAFQQSHGSGTTASILYAGPASTANENKYKNIQYLSYYPVEYAAPAVRENFLRYALNSKIKNSNIRIALDTGTKTSHQGYQQWIDMSGYDYHATSPAGENFAWDGYKPGYTTRRGDILRSGRTDLDYFASSPFCLSIWFYIVDDTQNFNIFYKRLDEYFTIKHVATSTIQVSTEQNGVGQFQNTISGIVKEKWHNIFVTGTSLIDVKFYIFTHTGETEVVQSATLTGSGISDPFVGNTDDIRFGDTNDYCRIASIVYWNTNFSQALCREFFSIQKGRFGMDSYSNRIADGDEFGCLPL